MAGLWLLIAVATVLVTVMAHCNLMIARANVIAWDTPPWWRTALIMVVHTIQVIVDVIAPMLARMVVSRILIVPAHVWLIAMVKCSKLTAPAHVATLVLLICPTMLIAHVAVPIHALIVLWIALAQTALMLIWLFCAVNGVDSLILWTAIVCFIWTIGVMQLIFNACMAQT